MLRILTLISACVLCSVSMFAQETGDPSVNRAIPDQPAEATREGSTDYAAPKNPLDQSGKNAAPAKTPPVIKVRVPSNLPTRNDDSGQDNASQNQITVFPLKHADASNVFQILTQLLNKADLDRKITVDNRLNAVIVSADAATIRQVEGLLKVLDAPEGAKPASRSSGSSSMFGGGRGGLAGSRKGFGGGGSRGSRNTPSLGGGSSRSSRGTRSPNQILEDTNASIDELRKAYAHYDQEAKQEAARSRASGKRTGMLRMIVKRAFETRQKLQRAELAEFEKRLDSIRQSIESRDRIANQIIDRRVEELMDPNLKWDPAKIEATASSDSELPAEKTATNIKDTRFGDPQHGLRMALVSSAENTTGDRVLDVSFVVQNVTERLQQFELTGLPPECDVRRTSKAQVETMLDGTSARRNRVTVRLQPGKQAAISTLRIRITDDVTVESVPQDSDLLIVDRNAFKFQNVVYVLRCTQKIQIDGAEVSLSSAPIAIAFSRPSVAQMLDGEWNVVEMEGGGHKATPDEVRGMKWSIKGTTITATQLGLTGKMEFELNPNTSPKQFDVSALDGNQKGQTSLGIYVLQDNRLRICFNDEGKTRPRDFTDATKRGYTLIVLEKASAASDAAGEVSAEQPPQLTPAAAGSQLRVLSSGRLVADNVVIRGSEGYTGSPLPSISETPSHKGVISLDKLEKGKTHWLLVRPSAVLKLDLAPVEAYYVRELPKRANLVGKNLDVNVYVQKTESDEFLLVTVLNRTKEAVAFSEADFHLMTAIKGPGADARVFSPVWRQIAEGKPPLKMTIQPGERHAFRLDWHDWVKNGFWFSRADETMAEPEFPELEPGRTWVRLTLGSAKPVSVTHPDIIIGKGQAGGAEQASSRESASEEVAVAADSRNEFDWRSLQGTSYERGDQIVYALHSDEDVVAVVITTGPKEPLQHSGHDGMKIKPNSGGVYLYHHELEWDSTVLRMEIASDEPATANFTAFAKKGNGKSRPFSLTDGRVFYCDASTRTIEQRKSLKQALPQPPELKGKFGEKIEKLARLIQARFPPEKNQAASDLKTHEVALAHNSRQALLDLDTGKTLGPIARGAPSDVPEYDVYVSFGAKNQVFLAHQLRKLGRVDAEFWDDASKPTILNEVRKLNVWQSRSKVQGAVPGLALPFSKKPQTFIVETKQGGVAILKAEYKDDIQTELSGTQQGFLVRYKLVPKKGESEIKNAAKPAMDEIQTELGEIQSLEESAEQKEGKEREQILRQSLEKYSTFYQKHRTQLAGLYARFYYGRCLRKLGEDKQAREVYDELLSLPGEGEAIKKLKESVQSDIDSSSPTAVHFGGDS